MFTLKRKGKVKNILNAAVGNVDNGGGRATAESSAKQCYAVRRIPLQLTLQSTRLQLTLWKTQL